MRHLRLLSIAAIAAVLLLGALGCAAASSTPSEWNTDVPTGSPAMYEFYTDG